MRPYLGEHVRQRNDMVLQERARLAAEIEALRTGPSPLEEAHAKHQEHVSDRDKFRSLLTNLQAGILCNTVFPRPFAWRSRYLQTRNPDIPYPLASCKHRRLACERQAWLGTNSPNQTAWV